MNWQLAIAIPITFTGFLLLLESIEDMLNRFEGGAQLARPQKRSAPSLVTARQDAARARVLESVEWPLPWATLEVDYSEQIAHLDQSPLLVDRSHIAQLPFQNQPEVSFAERREANESVGGTGGAFSHLQGIRVRDMEECY
jgi:hypothetical protein